LPSLPDSPKEVGSWPEAGGDSVEGQGALPRAQEGGEQRTVAERRPASALGGLSGCGKSVEAEGVEGIARSLQGSGNIRSHYGLRTHWRRITGLCFRPTLQAKARPPMGVGMGLRPRPSQPGGMPRPPGFAPPTQARAPPHSAPPGIDTTNCSQPPKSPPRTLMSAPLLAA
jgi:hypothetical protein